jgi:pimeloyl-ACP methyl ester carboxylesterase
VTVVPPEPPIAPPLAALLALEMRAGLELLGLVPALPWLRAAPRGCGSPVLVLPGYLADDVATRALRWFLRDRGHYVHGWRLGRNFGPRPDTVQGIAARLMALHERHGQRIALVGWSLGGIYARELARHFPDHVRQVITLGTPFRDVNATTVARLQRLGIGPRPDDRVAAFVERLSEPLPVPSTSILSRTDGIVAWRSCVEVPGPNRETIAVESSHTGMPHHPAVLLVLADRLAQPDGAWRPFDAERACRWPLLRAWPVAA